MLLIASLLLTGCETETPPTTQIPPTTVPGTISAPTTAPPETVSLTHAWLVGDTFAYDLEVRRRVVLAVDGSSEAPLDDLPPSAEVTINASGTVEVEVVEVTDAATRLTVTGDLDVTSVEGTVADEPVEDASALSALGDLLALPEEVLVDEAGVVSTGAPATRLVSDPLTAWTGFLGPVTPEQEVSVGEEWSRVVGRPAGTETEVRGSVTGTEALDGREVAAIEGASTVAAHEIDMSDFYRDFLGSFGEADGEVDPRLVLAHDTREERWEGRFEEGSLVTSDATATAGMRVEGVAADRDTGEEVAFEISLEIEDGLTARSVPPPEA